MLEDHINQPVALDAPFLLTFLMALLTFLGLTQARFRLLGRIMSVLVLMVSGILGCLIIFFWFFSNHACAKYNVNILWALPTNLILPFIRPRWKSRYALIGMWLILAPILLTILRIQVIPIYEIGPFLLALLFVYGSIYKRIA